MNVLITAPSLNEHENVSGVSSVVRSVVTYPEATHRYFHFQIGSKDGEAKRVGWFFTQVTLLPRLLRFTKRHDINLVHLNTDFTRASLLRDYLVLVCTKFTTGLPVLLHVHGGHLLMHPPGQKTFFGFVITKMLAMADEVVVLSEIEEKQLRNNYGLQPRSLPNAVARLEGARSEKHFAGKIRLIFLGRLVESKGIFLITDALKRLSEHYADLTFTFCGAGPELHNLLERLKKIPGLNYEYGGVVRGEEKWAVLGNSEVFLLPSLYGEGLPVAMLEAMQCGCVPVVSDDASITTVVRHKENGFVVGKGDLDALVDVLRHIMEERTRLASMSEAAKRTIAENYELPQYMEKLAAIYVSVTDKRQSGG